MPPQTRAVQCEEQGAVGGKKDKPCDPEDPADAAHGDKWDPGARDPAPRLVVSVVPGKRTADKGEKLGQDCKERPGGRPLNLSTSAE